MEKRSISKPQALAAPYGKAVSLSNTRKPTTMAPAVDDVLQRLEVEFVVTKEQRLRREMLDDDGA